MIIRSFDYNTTPSRKGCWLWSLPLTLYDDLGGGLLCDITNGCGLASRRGLINGRLSALGDRTLAGYRMLAQKFSLGGEKLPVGCHSLLRGEQRRFGVLM